MPGSFIQTAKRFRPVDLERIVFNGRKRDGQDAVAAGAQVIRMPVVKEREQTTTRFKHAGRLPAKRGVFMRTAARVIEEFPGLRPAAPSQRAPRWHASRCNRS